MNRADRRERDRRIVRAVRAGDSYRVVASREGCSAATVAAVVLSKAGEGTPVAEVPAPAEQAAQVVDAALAARLVDLREARRIALESAQRTGSPSALEQFRLADQKIVDLTAPPAQGGKSPLPAPGTPEALEEWREDRTHPMDCGCRRRFCPAEGERRRLVEMAHVGGDEAAWYRLTFEEKSALHGDVVAPAPPAQF